MRVPARFDGSALGLWVLAALAAAALAWSAGGAARTNPSPVDAADAGAGGLQWIELTPLPAPDAEAQDPRAPASVD